jgi:hypothetical protein
VCVCVCVTARTGSSTHGGPSFGALVLVIAGWPEAPAVALSFNITEGQKRSQTPSHTAHLHCSSNLIRAQSQQRVAGPAHVLEH